MTKQHINRLKELLLASKDLTEPMDYFLQHVITDAEIVRASQPAASAMLLHVILELVERHCGQEVFVLAPFFLHAAAYQFWHGGCHLGGYVTHLLYFDDVKPACSRSCGPRMRAAWTTCASRSSSGPSARREAERGPQPAA